MTEAEKKKSSGDGPSSSSPSSPLGIESVYPPPLLRESVLNDILIPSNNLSLSFREVSAVDVRVQDLSVLINTTAPLWQSSPSQLWNRIVSSNDNDNRRGTRNSSHKTILNGINAHMPPGSLTAIIGGSGSGKTSLLNVMAGRMEGGTAAKGRLKISGSITFNEVPSIRRIQTAYVMQQDILTPTLTVRETLQYSADLRLPPPLTTSERMAIVEQVLLELGLKECADTRIGNNVHKGCSGGEKRRTSIGVQMLANPSVLFCDEPTTGMYYHISLSLSLSPPRDAT